MGKTKKFNWTYFGLGCILAGIVLFSIGWLSGARGAYFTIGNRHISLFSLGSDWGAETAEWSLKPLSGNITEISVSTTAAGIIIEGIDTDETVGVEFKNIPRDAAEFRNGVLTVDSTEYERGGLPQGGTIRIRIPLDETVRIKANSVSGRVDIINITYDDINVNTTSGAIQLMWVTGFMDISLGSVSGAIDVMASSWQNLRAHSVSGALNASIFESDAAETYLSTVSGRITADVIGSSRDFNYSISTTSGVVTINGTRHSGQRATHTGGSGHHPITITTVSGRVQFNYGN
ncbi:MAG: DUF4097 domain-containing protein [Defluviitaleaceae bacterium]|nr:DUF4097 domain-containing protein [Defluviitaleaceae bacterium]